MKMADHAVGESRNSMHRQMLDLENKFEINLQV